MRTKTFLALALAGAFSISAAVATTLAKKMDLREMAAAASVAVVGKVTASRTVKTDNGLVTVSNINVVNRLWGTNADTLEIEVPGGSQTIGRFRLGEVVAGSPLLVSGQQAVFLVNQASNSGRFTLVGFNQGLLQVLPGNKVMLPSASEAVSLDAAMNKITEAKTSRQPADGLQR